MKPPRLPACICLLLLCCQTMVAETKALSNADVVKMVKADLGEPTILLAIQGNPHHFDLSVDGLIALKSAGVPSKVIEAMLAPRPPAPGGPAPNLIASINAPSEAEVRAILEKTAEKDSEGVITFLSFRKTNGQAGSENGILIYRMDFEATLRFSRDCIWDGIQFLPVPLGFAVNLMERPKPGENPWNGFAQSFRPGPKVAAGETFTISAKIELERTEQGWRPTGTMLQTATRGSEPSARAGAPTTNTTGNTDRKILANLAQLQAAAWQYYLESGTDQTTLASLVGPDKYVKALVPVNGEDYGTIKFKQGQPLEITLPDGRILVLTEDETSAPAPVPQLPASPAPSSVTVSAPFTRDELSAALATATSPATPSRHYQSPDGTVSCQSDPAELTLQSESNDDSTIRFTTPGSQISGVDGDHLVLRHQTKGFFMRNLTTEAQIKAELEAMRSLYQHLTLVGPVSAKLGGDDGLCYVATGWKDGHAVIAAVTVAIHGKNIHQAYLTARAENFSKLWNAYRQAMSTYKLAIK